MAGANGRSIGLPGLTATMAGVRRFFPSRHRLQGAGSVGPDRFAGGLQLAAVSV
ncbi:hypothetical protein HNQ58_002065 [Rehaibacterium terrae]|jgi:hypothetical protein|uniref:Uncharacterized protein n=1 Tax=Rehaibacterium terrae TaxID=1341696 RepID=A0A7W7Y123_9GAMM|nr:hypothetical protein [Rehaibacterium terrae]